MFFRLPKNTIKNLHFGPFGGGYPPSPPPPLNIASAYAFIRKIINFNKKTFKTLLSFSFGLGGLHVRAFRDERLHPPQRELQKRLTNMQMTMDGCIVICFFSYLLVATFGALGGGVRVRTRNALHEVGADLSQA